MKKNLGPTRAFRSIQNLIYFSEKNLKIKASVYALILSLGLFGSTKSFGRCSTIMGWFLGRSGQKLILLGQSTKINVKGLGLVDEKTYELLKVLRLIDSNLKPSHPYHHQRAEYLSKSPLFQKLLGQLRSENSITTGASHQFRSYKLWQSQVRELDAIIVSEGFQKDLQNLSDKFALSFKESLELVFLENSLSPNEIINIKSYLNEQASRLGLSDSEGFKVVLPLFNFENLDSANKVKMDAFVLKYGLDLRDFLSRWSAHFPSIAFKDLEALWPHVMAASKILRENRQFRISPYEFLRRVHTVDSSLVGILTKFGLLEESPSNQIATLRTELRGWKKYLIDRKRDREFLNPHLTEDVINNFKMDTFVNAMSEVIFTTVNLYNGVQNYEKLSFTLRNLFSDLLGDFYYNVMAPDEASKIVKGALKDSKGLQVLDRFTDKLKNVDKLESSAQDGLLKEFWDELNPNKKHFSVDQIKQEILKDDYWAKKASSYADRHFLVQFAQFPTKLFSQGVLLYRDLRGTSPSSNFIWTLAVKTANEAIWFGLVGAILGGPAEMARVYLTQEDATDGELFEAFVRGALLCGIYSAVWSTPRYVLLYDFNPQRMARILQRKGISPDNILYEDLRSKMHKNAGRINAWIDAVPFPFLSAEFMISDENSQDSNSGEIR